MTKREYRRELEKQDLLGRVSPLSMPLPRTRPRQAQVERKAKLDPNILAASVGRCALR